MKYMIAVAVGAMLFFAGKSTGQIVPKEITVSLQDANVDCSHKDDSSAKPCQFHKVTLILNDDGSLAWR